MLKNLLLLSVVLGSTQLLAGGSKAPGGAGGGGGVIGGNGVTACVVQDTDSFSLVSYIGRAGSKMLAQTEAQNKCAEGATFASDCSQAKCERDGLNQAGLTVEIISKRSGTTVNLSIRGAVNGAEVVVKNNSFSEELMYYAEAPTLVEARALAMNACVEEATFPSSCEVKQSRRY